MEAAPKVATDEMMIFTAEQVREVIAKLRGRAMYARAITASLLACAAGSLALRWGNTDLDGEKVIKVREAVEQTKVGGLRFKAPKTKAGRRDVTLPDIVIDALREHRKQQLEFRMALGLGKPSNDVLVFPALNGGPQAPRTFSKEWAVTANSLGFSELTFHALRHTHASQLIDAGIDIVTISKRLGHASPNITLTIYAHLFRERDDKAANAINDALAGLGKA